MESEFKRIYWRMINSDTIADGEYYVIHADHIHDFKRAVEHYFEEDKKIEKLKKNHKIGGCVDGEHYYEELYDIEDIGDKINEIIDKINRMEM